MIYWYYFLLILFAVVDCRDCRKKFKTSAAVSVYQKPLRWHIIFGFFYIKIKLNLALTTAESTHAFIIPTYIDTRYKL